VRIIMTDTTTSNNSKAKAATRMTMVRTMTEYNQSFYRKSVVEYSSRGDPPWSPIFWVARLLLADGSGDPPWSPIFMRGGMVHERFA